MNSLKSRTESVARRAGLLAELFFQDLGAAVVSHPASDSTIDFIVAIPNDRGGTNLSAVEVKATERPVGNFFPLKAEWLRRLAHTNVPSLLLLVDAKQNRLYHAWPGDYDTKPLSAPRRQRQDP